MDCDAKDCDDDKDCCDDEMMMVCLRNPHSPMYIQYVISNFADYMDYIVV